MPVVGWPSLFSPASRRRSWTDWWIEESMASNEVYFLFFVLHSSGVRHGYGGDGYETMSDTPGRLPVTDCTTKK